MKPPPINRSLLGLFHRLARACRPVRLRNILEFAEQEIIVPGGPHDGERFRASRQPFARLWFEQVSSGHWIRLAATGPTQTGKTFLCIIIIVCYHIFERKESVVFGIPNMDMAADKWNLDLLPVMAANPKWRELLPSSGAGSKGGKFSSLQFRHGPVLRFMSGRGSDESRSGFTAPVVVITEADKMDTAGNASREADPITQIEKRTDSFLATGRKRIYLECTVSIAEGRIWQEITQGSNSRIGIRCPHCRSHVTPEREHLVGWQEAPDLIAAGQLVALVCPACGVQWSEADRLAANADCVLIHRDGKDVDLPDGQRPRTDTLGFRWTVVNNLLAPLSDIGQGEWRGRRSADGDNAEKELCQFRWARPFVAEAEDPRKLVAEQICHRITRDPAGVAPSDTKLLAVGVDCGKRLLHWTATAKKNDGGSHIVAYGRAEVPTDVMGDERKALLAALRELAEWLETEGFEFDGAENVAGRLHPSLVLIDEGYLPDPVRSLCAEFGEEYLPAKGFGAFEFFRQGKRYSAPKRKSRDVAHVGEGYHLSRMPGGRRLMDINADQWKSELHRQLRADVNKGGLTLHDVGLGKNGAKDFNEHLSLAKHLLAEKEETVFAPGEGQVTKWRAVSRNNHFLDSTALSLVALDYALHVQEDGKGAGDGWFAARNKKPQRSDPNEDLD